MAEKILSWKFVYKKSKQTYFIMCTISSFTNIENKHGVYRGKDCMKIFFEFLREHVMKIINSKKWNY